MKDEQSSGWVEAETTTHQDHVIAHVIGATVLGYLIFDETSYLLLDIGFVWNIYLDGEMGLVPHPMLLAQLDIDEKAKSELRCDIDALLGSGPRDGSMQRMTKLQLPTPIQAVDVLRKDDSLRLVLSCDHGGLVIETSVETREIDIVEFADGADELN
jgi:hypothetical protein